MLLPDHRSLGLYISAKLSKKKKKKKKKKKSISLYHRRGNLMLYFQEGGKGFRVKTNCCPHAEHSRQVMSTKKKQQFNAVFSHVISFSPQEFK